MYRERYAAVRSGIERSSVPVSAHAVRKGAVMGPHGHLSAVPGADHAADQVARLREFIRRHPGIAVTSPRQNGTSVFQAVWTDGTQAGGTYSGVVVLATHEELRCLLDYLEARFDRGAGG